MEARVELGRIKVSFPEEMSADEVSTRQLEVIEEIGSARPVEKNERELSCALSIQNFRKLRKLGCKLADGHLTRETVDRLRIRLDSYNAESARGDLVKRGDLVHEYTFKKEPLGDHQVKIFNFLHAMTTPAVFGDVGVGKTFCIATYADSRVKAGDNIAVLVICPVNLIEHVWLEDVAKFTDLTAVSLRSDARFDILAADYDEKKDPTDPRLRAQLRAQRRLDSEAKKKAKKRATKRFNEKVQVSFDQIADVYVLNPESLRTDIKEKRVIKLLERLLAEGKKVILVVDESSKLKSRLSRTYKSLKRIRRLAEQCVIMTGTPSPNGLPDLWAQFDLVDGGLTLQPNFVDYRHDTCDEVVLRNVTWKDKRGVTRSATRWEPKPGIALQVYAHLEPRVIRFRTQDCINLPPKRFIVRDVEMNNEQLAVYEAMEEMLFAEFEGQPITARVAAAKLMKLREVTGGFVITDAGETKRLGKDSPKMIELDLLLEQSIADKLGDEGPPNKALVWAQYQWECKELVKRYRHYGARGLYGGISQKEKDDAIRRFKSDDSARLLVCHPASAGHGLTLTEASFAFYYSLSYNFEEFYQSHARIARPGQKKTMAYYFLVCPGTIDEELIDAIRAKKNLSDVVTDGRLSKDQFLERRAKAAANRGAQTDIDWGAPAPDQPAAGGHETAGQVAPGGLGDP